MRKSSLWRIGAPLMVICFLFSCTTAIEHESISTIAVDPTWTPVPTSELPATIAVDPTWTPTPTPNLTATAAADHTGTPAATLDLHGKIAFTSDRDGDQNIYVMNADGTDQRRLTDDPAQDWSPAWSPDGRSITFYSYRDGNQDVYVMNANGSDQRNLSQIPDMGPSLSGIMTPPSWSPDGHRIVFGSGYRGDMGYRIYEIYVMDADGSNLQNLGYGLSPVWSPNGNYIVFVCGHYPNWAVCKMNANGTHRHRVNLALDGTWSKDHTRSPDGRYITFSSCRDGNCEIYVMNADGTDQRNLTQHPAMDSNPAWSP